MQKCIRKYLSVILSLLLVIGVVSPIITMKGVNAEGSDKANAIANLKETWGEMYKADTLMSPTIEKISGTNTQSSVYNTADGIEGLPAGITADELGDYYAHHTGVYGTTGTDENRFMWSKSSSGSSVESSLADISVYDDLSVSFYVEDVAAEGSFNIDLLAQGTSADVANTTYNITEADEGKWITLKGDDMRVNGFAELISKMAEVNNGSHRLYFFQFTLGSNKTKFKGYFGSLLGLNYATLPEYTDELDLISQAQNLDISGYKNTAAFVDALATAEELYAEELISYDLKTAWGEMGTTTSWLYPQFYRRADGSDQDNLYSVSNVLTDVTDIATYGEQTVTIDMQSSGRTAPDLTNSYTLFMGAKPTESLSAVLNRGRVVTGAESDIYLYIKVNSVTTAGRIGFKAVGNSAQYLSSVTKDINSEAIGQWQKISFSDIMPMSSITDWKSFFSNTSNDYFGRFELMLLDGAVANLTISCIVREFAVTDVPELSGLELVRAAMDLNISSYVNTENFVAALDDAKEYYKKELSVDALKEAWGEMYKTDTLMSPTIEKVSGTNTQSTVYNTADGIEILPAGITADELGDYYAHHTGVYGTTGTDENRFMWSKYTSGTGVEYSRADIANYDDLRVSFYVEDVATAGSFNIDLYSSSTSDCANKTYSITESDEGKWITFTAADINSGGMSGILTAMKANDGDSNAETAKLGFFQFGLGSDATKFKGYFGSLLGITNAEVPELSGVALIAAANKLDVSEYKNADAFIEARAEAAELYATELALLNANEEIKTAYNKIYVAADAGLKPVGQKINNAGAALINSGNIFSIADGALPYGATAEMLGDYYAFHDINDNTVDQDLGKDSYDRILFCGRADRWNFGDGIDISEYDGFYINIYYETVNSGGKIYNFLTGNGTANQKTGNTWEITADDAGKWHTYTDQDVVDGGIATIKSIIEAGGGKFSTLMLSIEDGLDIEAYVGSMVLYKNIEESTLDTASDTFLSDMRNVNLSGLYNKEQFINTIIDETNALAETYADNKEVIGKIRFSDDCNAYGGVDLRDLVRIARYLDGDDVKIDKLAADGSGNGTVDTDDEALLKTKLLNQ